MTFSGSTGWYEIDAESGLHFRAWLATLPPILKDRVSEWADGLIFDHANDPAVQVGAVHYGRYRFEVWFAEFHEPDGDAEVLYALHASTAVISFVDHDTRLD